MGSLDGDGPDTGAALAGVCRVATVELGLLGAVVTLMTEGAATTVQAVAGASDETGHALEAISFSLGEGPGPDAFATGRPVLVPDVEAAFARWPAWVPPARRAGVCSAYAFPLQLGAVRFGSLTLYDGRRRTLPPDEVATCLSLAEIATESLLAGSVTGSVDTVDPGLGRALRFRSEVYQAQGKVAVQLGVDLVDALVLMRARAFADDRDLTELAVAILDGTIELTRHD